MVELVRHRQTKGAATDMFEPTATAPHLDSTEDCLSENYQDAPTDGSAGIVGRDCKNRIVRGGSWQNTPDHLRSAARLGPSLGFRDNLLGFRTGRTLNSP
jgi:hypothetical protein